MISPKDADPTADPKADSTSGSASGGTVTTAASRLRLPHRIDVKVDSLARHPALAHLRRRQVMRLIHTVDLVPLPAGMVLARCGDRPDSFLLLDSGEVHVGGHHQNAHGLVVGAPCSGRASQHIQTVGPCLAWIVDVRYQDWFVEMVHPRRVAGWSRHRAVLRPRPQVPCTQGDES